MTSKLIQTNDYSKKLVIRLMGCFSLAKNVNP